METKVLGGLILCIMLIVLISIIIIIVKRSRDPFRVGVSIIDSPVEMSANLTQCCNDLPQNGYEHSYSFWMFVKNWEQGPEYKYVFQRIHDFNILNVVLGSSKPNLKVFLTDEDNNLIARKSDDDFTYTDYDEEHELPNLPIQTWNHLVLVIYDKTLDLYLNGKLARTFLLAESVQSNETNMPIGVGGYDVESSFKGFLSRFRYIPKVLNPNEVYNLYLKGPAKPSELSAKPLSSDITINIDEKKPRINTNPSCASAN